MEKTKILVSLFLSDTFIGDCYCLLLKIYSFHFPTMTIYYNLHNKNHKFLLNIDAHEKNKSVIILPLSTDISYITISFLFKFITKLKSHSTIINCLIFTFFSLLPASHSQLLPGSQANNANKVILKEPPLLTAGPPDTVTLLARTHVKRWIQLKVESDVLV